MPNRLTRGRALVGALSIDAQDITISDDLSVGDDATIAGDLTVTGSITFGDQQAAISDPSGGATQDAEARTAIEAIIDALEAVGILEASA